METAFCALPSDRRSLRTYQVELPHGRRRFHLRTSADGAAVLLVDAADAIHLNATAALLTGLALEGVPAGRAATVLLRRFHGVDPAEARAAADKVYALVERLTAATGSCPTCAACG